MTFNVFFCIFSVFFSFFFFFSFLLSTIFYLRIPFPIKYLFYLWYDRQLNFFFCKFITPPISLEFQKCYFSALLSSQIFDYSLAVFLLTLLSLCLSLSLLSLSAILFLFSLSLCIPLSRDDGTFKAHLFLEMQYIHLAISRSQCVRPSQPSYELSSHSTQSKENVNKITINNY